MLFGINDDECNDIFDAPLVFVFWLSSIMNENKLSSILHVNGEEDVICLSTTDWHFFTFFCQYLREKKWNKIETFTDSSNSFSLHVPKVPKLSRDLNFLYRFSVNDEQLHQKIFLNELEFSVKYQKLKSHSLVTINKIFIPQDFLF